MSRTQQPTEIPDMGFLHIYLNFKRYLSIICPQILKVVKKSKGNAPFDFVKERGNEAKTVGEGQVKAHLKQ